jgi:RND family efflux transporter MFP subunit
MEANQSLFPGSGADATASAARGDSAIAGPSRSSGGEAAQGAPDHEEHYDFTTLPNVRTRSIAIGIAVAVCALAGLFLLGWMPRQERLQELGAAASARDDRPSVDVGPPKETARSTDLRLPADIRAMQETSIYTRANGYLKRILVDIGDHVDSGALLAEIDTPDVDAELARAIASVSLAKANVAKAQDDFALADATLKRYTGLAETGGVTHQQLDEKRSAFTQAKSALDAGKASLEVTDAEVRRLTVLQGFERVVAPFAGTITARNYDVGALLAPTNTSDGRELYRLERTDALRVFVNVPQAYATGVKVGEDAFLTVRNYPGREFTGKVARSTGAVDPTTRTLRFQVDVSNADGKLYAGMYGEVRLPTSSEQASLTVPTSALVFGAEGTFVWILDGDRAHKKKVALGRDFGTEIEVIDGLSPSDSVVKNPGERLVEGARVRSPNPKARAASSTDSSSAAR